MILNALIIINQGNNTTLYKIHSLVIKSSLQNMFAHEITTVPLKLYKLVPKGAIIECLMTPMPWQPKEGETTSEEWSLTYDCIQPVLRGVRLPHCVAVAIVALLTSKALWGRLGGLEKQNIIKTFFKNLKSIFKLWYHPKKRMVLNKNLCQSKQEISPTTCTLFPSTSLPHVINW